MAPGMKNWLGLMALGMALVAVWALPPDGPRERSQGIVWPQEQEMRALHDELKTKEATLRRIRWSDSLSALTLATATEGTALSFPDAFEIEEEAETAFRAGLDREVRELPVRGDLVFGYVYQFAHHGRLSAMNTGGISLGDEFYAGVRDGQAYCLKVRPAEDARFIADSYSSAQQGRDGIVRPSNYLGACRPFVAYGYPGPAIRAWLKQGALEFGAKPSNYYRQEEEMYGRNVRTGPFGVRYGFAAGYRSLVTEQCLTGDAEACLKRVADPQSLHWRRADATAIVQGSPLLGIDDQDWRTPLERSDDYLLADLADAFGHDAFRAFWTSDKDVPVAFEEAFGVEMGEWVSSWVTAGVGMSKAGPGLTRSAGFGGLLAMSVLAIIGGAWARRRRVA